MGGGGKKKKITFLEIFDPKSNVSELDQVCHLRAEAVGISPMNVTRSRMVSNVH